MQSMLISITYADSDDGLKCEELLQNIVEELTALEISEAVSKLGYGALNYEIYTSDDLNVVATKTSNQYDEDGKKLNNIGLTVLIDKVNESKEEAKIGSNELMNGLYWVEDGNTVSDLCDKINSIYTDTTTVMSDYRYRRTDTR